MTIISVPRCSSLLALCLMLLAVGGCAPDGEESVEVTQSALVTGDVGFALAGGAGSYDTASATSWNNHGGVNHSTALATVGTYRVDFPNLGGSGGNVQVGGTNAGPNSHGVGSPVHCKVVNWGASFTTEQVFVNCYTIRGILSSGTFFVAFQRRSGNIGPESGYAWANQPTVSSYTPSLTYQWNSAGGNVTITRESTGVYLVNFPGQGSGLRAVQATAYGSDGNVCSPGNGSGDGTARVRCFNAAGAVADSTFTIAYSALSVDNLPSYTFAYVQTPGTVLGSYGAVASQCGPDQPISTAVTATGSISGTAHVHFPQQTITSSTQVIAMPYNATSRIICNVVNRGNETGGAFADVECWADTMTRALGVEFVVAFSNIVAIFC